MVASGRIKVEIKQRFALKDAAEAHRALEARADLGLDGADHLAAPLPFCRSAE